MGCRALCIIYVHSGRVRMGSSRLLEMLPKTNVRYVPVSPGRKTQTHTPKTGNYSVAGIQTRTHPNTWHCRACTINHTSSLLLCCPLSNNFCHSTANRELATISFRCNHTQTHTHTRIFARSLSLSFSLILVLLYYLCVACHRVAMCCVLRCAHKNRRTNIQRGGRRTVRPRDR